MATPQGTGPHAQKGFETMNTPAQNTTRTIAAHARARAFYAGDIQQQDAQLARVYRGPLFGTLLGRALASYARAFS